MLTQINTLDYIVENDSDFVTLNTLNEFNDFLTQQNNTSSGFLKIIHLNIRSLRSNFDELQAILNLSINEIHVLILSEIWIYDYETPKYSLNGFDSYFFCRDFNKSGGIVVYVKSHLNLVNDRSFSMNTAESILLHDVSLD